MTMPDVLDNVGNQQGRNIAPTYGYYRQPNGWITLSPNTATARMRYMEEGWEYLHAYGAFDITPYTIGHPFEGLFMFGGAKELPVEQVLQTGLYIAPTPLVPVCRQHLTQYHRAHNAGCWRGAKRVEFPQLAGVPPEAMGPFICEFCPLDSKGEKRKLPTAQARTQHQSVAHKEPLGNTQLGQALGDSLAAALKSIGGKDAEAQQARIAELEAALARRDGIRGSTPAGKAGSG